jgi:hypothetical protein
VVEDICWCVWHRNAVSVTSEMWRECLLCACYSSTV